jgi:hypothetical protein
VSDVVNLRQARKRRRREEKERTAEANRLLHGRPKEETLRTRLARDMEARRLDGHRRAEPEAEA